MLRRLQKKDLKTISIPFNIKSLFETEPNIDIELMDYDYVENAKEEDYISFATKLYAILGKESHFMLAMYSNEMKDSRLLRKSFRFNLEGYVFSERIENIIVSLNDKYTVFLGIISIKTDEDFKTAVKFLFSGTYDSKNILIYSRESFDKFKIIDLLQNSLEQIKNRYGDIQKINLSMTLMSQYKKDIKVLYPYGGTDFGSFMIFMF